MLLAGLEAPSVYVTIAVVVGALTLKLVTGEAACRQAGM